MHRNSMCCPCDCRDVDDHRFHHHTPQILQITHGRSSGGLPPDKFDSAFIVLTAPSASASSPPRCRSTSWRNTSWRRGEVGCTRPIVLLLYYLLLKMLEPNRQIFFPVASFNFFHFFLCPHRGLPASDIQAPGEYIT